MVTDGAHDVVSVLFGVDVNRFVKKKCGRLVGAAKVLPLTFLWLLLYLHVAVLCFFCV